MRLFGQLTIHHCLADPVRDEFTLFRNTGTSLFILLWNHRDPLFAPSLERHSRGVDGPAIWRLGVVLFVACRTSSLFSAPSCPALKCSGRPETRGSLLISRPPNKIDDVSSSTRYFVNWRRYAKLLANVDCILELAITSVVPSCTISETAAVVGYYMYHT